MPDNQGALRSRLTRLGRALLALCFWLALWAVLARRVGLELLLPGPGQVCLRLWQLAGTADFWRSVAVSLLRVLCGFAAGAGLGTLLAALTCASRLADTLLSPAVRVIRATPVASFILLFMLWIKSALLPGVMAAMMVLPVVWQAAAQGITATDRGLLELALAYRFRFPRTLKLVYIPSVAPYLRQALLTGLGLAWKSGVAAEVLSSPKWAVGHALNNAKIYLETPDLFAWTVTVVVLSLLMEAGLKRLLGRLPGGEAR